MPGPVAPLGGHPLLLFLAQVGLLLAVAVALGRLATALWLPAIVGELCTGIVLGPSLLGAVAPGWFLALFPQHPEQMHMLDALGQVGVILLVALTGMHLDLGLIRKRGRTAGQVSLPGFVIPLALGVAAGLLLPATLLSRDSNRVVFAAFVGIAMCVSAIPVIAKTLLDMKLLHRNVGQLILISGTVDDLLGWLCLSVATGLATSGAHPAAVVRSVCLLILFVCVALLVGRPLVGLALRATTRSTGSGLTITVAMLTIVLFSTVTLALGLEAVFGAMVAGIVLSAAAPQLRTRLAPLRPLVLGVLAPVFFATVGLRMDLTTLARPVVLATAALLLVLAVAGKFAGAFLGSWVSRLDRWEALAVAAGMNARGVVGVIIAAIGLRVGVFDTAMYTIVVLIAIATSVMGPPVLRLATRRIELGADEQLRLADFESAFPTEAEPAVEPVVDGARPSPRFSE